MKRTTRSLTRAALVAALYVLLTLLFQPISFREVQFRVAEALTLLPVLTVDAVPGLFVGCLLANLLGGALWFDVALGSVATLLAAICARALRNRPLVAALMPALFNGIIVGPVVYFAYVRPAGAAVNAPALLYCAGTVALGELAVCYTLGLFLLRALRRVPERLRG